MKQLFGYLLGFSIFIAGIPTLMWWAAGMPEWAGIPAGRLYPSALLALIGLALSVWSIVYMKRVGKGNPFDAMGHELAPRTRHLMTEGPYKISRNPMLSGTYLYYIGILVALWNAWALLLFSVIAAVMMLQVRSEEKRLEADFGQEYLDYKKRTGRFITLPRGTKSIFAVCLLTAISCSRHQGNLQNGDLIFVGLPMDYHAETGSMDEAISSATNKEGVLNLIHVAIAEVKADSVWIIDATIARGVDRHPLDTFLRDFTLKSGAYPEFIVKRVKGVDADAAVQRAKSFCGRQYDVRFLPDNEDLYCSELVQKSYLDADGNPVFKSEPMNFKAPDGTMPPYWEWLFGLLGMDVPQGVAGTNPQKMAEAQTLSGTLRLRIENIKGDQI